LLTTIKPTVILNLASLEYSKLLDRNLFSIIDLYFLNDKNKKLDNASSKRTRGQILNYCIVNQITNFTDLKSIKETNISFVESLSNEQD